MKKGFLALALALVATTALAQPPLLGHNGSIMQLNDAPNGTFTIIYVQPKPSLLAIGVVPGTLLISGQIDIFGAGTTSPSHLPTSMIASAVQCHTRSLAASKALPIDPK